MVSANPYEETHFAFSSDYDLEHVAVGKLQAVYALKCRDFIPSARVSIEQNVSGCFLSVILAYVNNVQVSRE